MAYVTQCLFINHFCQWQDRAGALEDGTLHAPFEVCPPRVKKAGGPERAGYGRISSNLDRCIWIAGELRCPVPIAERAHLGKHTARRPWVQNESEQAATRTQLLQEISDAARLLAWKRANVGAASAGGSAHFDPGHFDRQSKQNASRDLLAKRIFASTPSQTASHYPSETESLMRRAGSAATSVVVTHDDMGRRRLNTSYLLRVLTTTAAHSAAAHSAYVPYWRRPLLQPASAASTASDFGSTIGEDAGINVFHEFKPGILQLMKSHEPKFVFAIGERISNK